MAINTDFGNGAIKPGEQSSSTRPNLENDIADRGSANISTGSISEAASDYASESGMFSSQSPEIKSDSATVVSYSPKSTTQNVKTAETETTPNTSAYENHVTPQIVPAGVVDNGANKPKIPRNPVNPSEEVSKEVDKAVESGYFDPMLEDKGISKESEAAKKQVEKHSERLKTSIETALRAPLRVSSLDTVVPFMSRKKKVDTPRPSYGMRTPSAAKSFRDKQEKRLSDKRVVATGNDVSMQLFVHPDVSVGVDEVSVGSDILLASIRQNSVLLSRVNDGLSKKGIPIDFAYEDFLGSQREKTMSKLIDAINSLDIQVTTTKSPVSERTSNQIRTLRAHLGAGVSLHPLIAKSFNADFDGDPATVHLGEDAIQFAVPAIMCLRGIDGKPTIDPDFICVSVLQNWADANSLELLFKAGGMRSDEARDLAEAIVKYGESEFDETLVSLVERRYNRNDARASMKSMARLFNTAYSLIDEAARGCIASYAEDSYFIQPENAAMITMSYSDEELMRIIEEGHIPANYQDLVSALSKFDGDIAKKNPHFRVGADIAKIARFDQEIYLGGQIDGCKINPDGSMEFNGDLGMRKLFQLTVKAMFAKQMAKKAFLGEERESAGEWRKTYVIKTAGMPCIKGTMRNFEEWYEKFSYAYNVSTELINVASRKWLTDMSPAEANSSKPTLLPLTQATAEEISDAFLNIYGIGFTMESVFGGIRRFDSRLKQRSVNAEEYSRDKIKVLPSRYRMMSPREFSKVNKIIRPANERRDRSTPISNEDNMWDAVFYAVADHRQSEASKRNKNFEQLLSQEIQIIRKNREIFEGSVDQSIDGHFWESVMEVTTEAMVSAGVDMFAYYGMDGFDTFWDSEWGKLILKADTPDHLGGIYYSMQAEYKLDRIANILRDMNGDLTFNVEYEQLARQLESELNALASSSDLWDAIVSEIRTGNKIWKMCVENGFSKACSTYLTKDAHSNVVDMGISNIDFAKYDSVIEFLSDPSIGKAEKDAVLSDITRFHSRSVVINAYEMAFMLDMGASDIYSGSNTAGFTESTSDPLEDAIKKTKIVPDPSMYKDVLAIAKSDDGEQKLQSIISFVAQPHNRIEVSDDAYYDFVVSSMDKGYHDAEKSTQLAVNSGGYQTLSYQLGDGFYSDVYRGDNKALGRIGYDQLTANDFIMALADPSFSIDIYDRNGNLSSFNRDTILGGMSLCEFFTQNPSLAYLLCPIEYVAAQKADGSVYPVISMSLTDVLQFVEQTNSNSKFSEEQIARNLGNEAKRKALFYLRDHPAWGAACALFTPVRGKSTRNQRIDVKKTEDNLLWLLVEYSRTGKLPDLSSLKSDEFNPDGPWTEEEDYQSARDIPEILEERFSVYSAEMMSVFGKPIHMVDGIDTIMPEGQINLTFDKQSIRMFFDQRQTMSGSKTQKSTGVEGIETKKTSPSFLFMASFPNLYKMDGDNVVRIEEGEEPGESSIINRFFKCSASLGLALKRTKGGEDLNLKAKKQGDDGLDSVTKVRKYSTSLKPMAKLDSIKGWNDMKASLQAEYERTGDIFSIHMMLGHYLYNINRELGYDTITEADWCNHANMMVGVSSDGSLTILSIEQITAAIHYNLPRKLGRIDLKNVPVSDQIEACNQILNSLYENRGEVDILGAIYELKTPIMSAWKSPLQIRERSSSFERNFDLVKKLANIARKSGRMYVEGQDYNGRTVNKENASKAFLAEIEQKYRAAMNLVGDGGYTILGVIDDDHLNRYTVFPGQSNIIFVAPGSKRETIQHAISVCEKYGMTIAYDSFDEEKFGDYAISAIPFPSGAVYSGQFREIRMIPFFDIHLNGSGSPKSGRIVYNQDNIMTTVEDSSGRFSPADAAAVMTKSCIDRIKIDSSGEWHDNATDIFAATIEMYGNDYHYEYRMADPSEVENVLMKWKAEPGSVYYGGINDPSAPDVDLRISTSNPAWNNVVKKVQRQIEEFRYNWDTRTGTAIDCRPDMIVGWAAMDILDKMNGRVKHTVFAPIIPWTRYRGNTKRTPAQFEIIPSTLSFDPINGSFGFQWRNTQSLENQYVKIHEGLAAANKMIAFTNPVSDITLADGSSADVIYWSGTTASRRNGWNARLQTMYSMMMVARMNPFGYNFSDLETSFPDSPNVKERLYNGVDIPREEWTGMLADSNMRWSSDPKINAFVKNQITKCLEYGIHPDDFLASCFYDEAGRRIDKRIYSEWDLLFSPSFNYQDNLMYFLNSMMPSLCSKSIYDDLMRSPNEPVTTLFKARSVGNGWQKGCLQRLVSIPENPGKYTWENVYTSFGFFSNDFSGFHSPGVDGAHVMMQELASAIQAGQIPNDAKMLGYFLDYAYSDIAFSPKPCNFSAANVDFISSTPDVTWSKEEAVCFTGHRPDKLFGYDNAAAYTELKERTLIAIQKAYDMGKRVFINGGAQGFDQVAGWAVVEFKKTHPDIKAVMAVPYKSQGDNWKSSGQFSKRFYEALKKRMDQVEYIHDDPSGKEQARVFLNDRNEWMLDNSSMVIAMYNGTGGGTGNAVRSANSRGIEIINIFQHGKNGE